MAATGTARQERAETPQGGSAVEQAGELRSTRIESLRAIAALGVFVGHAFGTAHAYDRADTFATFSDRIVFAGGFGVFLFFALSGYLLYLPFAKQDLAGGRRVDLRTYARNRALRILPLYYVVVAVILIVQENGGSAKEWLLFTTFSENFSDSTLTKVNGVLWSLVVELHFYLLLPLIALLIARLARGSLGRAALVIGALGAASFALRYATFYDDLTPNRYLEFSIPSTFMFFTAGMLLVPIRLHWERRPPRWLRGPLALSSLWIVAAAGLYLVVAYNFNRGWLAAAFSFLLVGACVLPLRQGFLVRVLEWKPLAAVGIASYSLYLWHVPLLDWLDNIDGLVGYFPRVVAVATPVCLAAAFLSYRLIESPFLRLRRRWGATAAATAEK